MFTKQDYIKRIQKVKAITISGREGADDERQMKRKMEINWREEEDKDGIAGVERYWSNLGQKKTWTGRDEEEEKNAGGDSKFSAFWPKTLYRYPSIECNH